MFFNVEKGNIAIKRRNIQQLYKILSGMGHYPKFTNVSMWRNDLHYQKLSSRT